MSGTPAASHLLDGEQFVRAGCFCVGERFVAVDVVGEVFMQDAAMSLDLGDLADVFALFTVEAGGSTYGGGES